MGNTTQLSLTILPKHDKQGDIDPNALEFIKDNNLPFVVNTDWKLLAELGRDHIKDWSLHSITSHASYNNSHVVSGYDFIDHIEKLYTYLNAAVLVFTTSSECDAYSTHTNYKEFCTGKIVSEFDSYQRGIYTDAEYLPKTVNDIREEKIKEENPDLPF